MMRRTFRKSILSAFYTGVSSLLITVLVILLVVYGLKSAEESSRTEGKRILEESLNRAITKCYAVEGSYPASLAYIEANYGVHIDRSRFVVDYRIFASNILPSVSVIELRK